MGRYSERAMATMARYRAAATELPSAAAVTVPELFEAWSGGEAIYKVGDRARYGELLYKCLTDHTSQTDWAPDAAPSLWVRIDETHAGTIDDPIPAVRGMEYQYGLYYLDDEDGKTYLCERIGETEGGKIILQYLPHELVGQYFTEVVSQ